MSLLSATLLGMAMTNYFFYDRFALSYVLAEQCAGCDGPATSGYAGPACAGLLGAYVLALRRAPAPERHRWWTFMTGMAIACAFAALTLAYRRAIRGDTQRWAAMSLPMQVSLSLSLFLGVSTILMVALTERRSRLIWGTPTIAVVAATTWAKLALELWNRQELVSPMAKVSGLLEGSAETVGWWKVSLTAQAAVGMVVVLRAQWRRPDIFHWAGCAAAITALWLTVPYARDALSPLAQREAVPANLSPTASCFAPDFVDVVRLSRPLPPVPPGVAGYLQESLDTPTPQLLPQLKVALTAGIRTIVVPGRRRETIPTSTLGPVSFDEACLAWRFDLTDETSAVSLTDFATLASLVQRRARVRPE